MKSFVLMILLCFAIFSCNDKTKQREKMFTDLTKLTSKELVNFITDSVLPSIVLINVYDKDKKGSLGGGFFINKSEIITCRHIMIGASSHAEITVLPEGNVYPINQITGLYYGKDIIKMSLGPHEKIGRPIKIAYVLPKMGDTVWVVGFRHSKNKIHSKLINTKVTGIASSKGKFDFIISARIDPGDSGGPVINKRGEVIGIVISGTGKNVRTPSGFILATHSIKELKPPKEKDIFKWVSIDGIKKEDYFKNGLLYRDKRDFNKAIYFFEKVIEIDSINKESYFWVGKCSFQVGNYLQALVAFERLIEIEPKDFYGHYELGLTYLSLGKKKAAIAEYETLKDLIDKEDSSILSRHKKSMVDHLIGLINEGKTEGIKSILP